MKTASVVAHPQRQSSPWTRLVHHPLNRELVVVALLILAFVVSSLRSTNFLDASYLLDSTSDYTEEGLMALVMTFIIISGNIDLSVASTLALVAGVTAVLHAEHGVPFGAAMVCGLLLGAFLGFFNGLLIALFRLPSLTVTLGTFALYRGLTEVLLGDESQSGFPDWFAGIDTRHIGNTPIPLPLAIFLGLALIFGLLLHRSVLGRWTVALGTNEAASRYSGIAVDRVKILLFTLSGLMAGAAGLMMASRLGVARHDTGVGLELNVITAVVLGGTDIFGGRGTIFGTVTALFLVGVLRNGMGLSGISPETQLVIIGLLLIFSVLLPNLLQKRRI